MDEAGNVMFSGHLDPRAQEFRPGNPSLQNQITLIQPNIYYPYQSLYTSAGVQVLPFYDVGMGYQPSPQSTAYVRFSGAAPAYPPQLPPPSATATRALLLSSVPTDVTESMVKRELEVFGEVRAVDMEMLQEGIVTVHFYDLRHAQAAMMAIRGQHMQQQRRLRQHYNAVLMRPWGFDSENLAVPVPPPGRGLICGQVVWAQFTLPTVIPVADGHNQGTLVIFNLDSGVSACKLKEIFEAFGPVKELRETPSKQHQRFVEFFDIRDAARAMKEMEGKEIHGKRVLVEFSRPGGNWRRFSNTITTTTTYCNINSVNNSSNNNRSSYYSRINANYPVSPPPQPPHLPPKSFRRSTSDASSSNSTSIPLPPSKKSSVIRGNGTFNNSRRLNCGAAALAAPMASLSMSIAGNVKKINNCASTTKQQQQQQQGKQLRSNKSWKGRNKSSDSHFLIKEDEMEESRTIIRDTRTTVMIKNIPNKYSQKLLLNMLDNHCNHCNQQITDGEDQPLSSYDFVYLPIDFNNKCNVGYGFVNLTSPQATWRFYKAFHLQRWEVFNSRKICEVTYARLQGLEALKEHFKNSKFACETDEYLPVVFSPPRDGKQLTEPMAVGGHANAINEKEFLTGGSINGKDGSEEDEMGHDYGGDDDDDDDDEDDEEDDDDDDDVSSNGGDGNDDDEGGASLVPNVP